MEKVTIAFVLSANINLWIREKCTLCPSPHLFLRIWVKSSKINVVRGEGGVAGPSLRHPTPPRSPAQWRICKIGHDTNITNSASAAARYKSNISYVVAYLYCLRRSNVNLWIQFVAFNRIKFQGIYNVSSNSVSTTAGHENNTLISFGLYCLCANINSGSDSIAVDVYRINFPGRIDGPRLQPCTTWGLLASVSVMTGFSRLPAQFGNKLMPFTSIRYDLSMLSSVIGCTSVPSAARAGCAQRQVVACPKSW